ncbi:hypothetical protein K450DRAFT_254844 [Umbelopsis ramanniana AG]|uniref:Integral membrane protein n=1 Tax=Umbelopsis ramanniana AG TaxID=1314678 RepID=A0AAD5HAB1_UMBRA|nr:uncharacterized protein K450DRAFT_254844 [Umbelopsis ramanniana AG]KAI8576900.1 hypothetical protein K450DRAFT_254844 [Umbelopsis ramanniana AG]
MAAAPANPSLLTMYLTELAAHPLRTKALTSAVLSGVQEFTAQKLSGTKPTSAGPVDKRVVQMTLYGLLVSGPLNHVLYDILNKVFAGKTGPKAKLLQLLASNLIISPIFNCVYISAMTIIAGARSPSQVIASVKNGWFQMQKVSWVISPITMTFAQNFLPPHTWVPFFNLVAFVFGTYMNTKIKRRRIQAEKEAQGKKQ